MSIIIQILEIVTTTLVLTIGLAPAWAWIFANLNFCFTLVNTGEGKAVLKGKKFHRFLIEKPGHIILETEDMVSEYKVRSGYSDRERRKFGTGRKGEVVQWDVVPQGTFSLVKKGLLLRWVELLGARWFGISPFYEIDTRQQKWLAAKTNTQTGETILEGKDELVSSFFLKDVVVGHRLSEVETGGYNPVLQTNLPATGQADQAEMLPVNLEYLLTLRMTNPMKALFGVHRYLDAILERSGPAAKRHVGQTTYTGLIRERPETNEFQKNIKGIETDILEHYGMRFVAAEISKVDPGSPEAEKYRLASTAVYLATTAGEATMVTAQATANAAREANKATVEFIDQKGTAIATAAEKLTGALASKGQVAGEQATRVLTTADVAEAMKTSKGAIWFQGGGGQGEIPKPAIILGPDGQQANQQP